MPCCLPIRSLRRTRNGPVFWRTTSKPRSCRRSSNSSNNSCLERAMAIHVALHHQTVYRYDRRVSLGPQVVRLRPAPHCRTPILAYSLRVLPREQFLNWQQDPFGNYQARLVFPKKSAELAVEVDVVADMTVIDPFDFFVESSAEHYPVVYGDALRRELAQYLQVGREGPKFDAFVERARSADARPERRTVDVLV